MNNGNRSARNVRTRRTKTKALPKPRSWRSQVVIGLVGFAFIVVSVVTADTKHSFTDSIRDVMVALVSIVLPLLFLVELIFRLLYVFEEYSHLLTRYENSVKRLVKDVFHFHSGAWIIVMISIFLATIASMKLDEYPHKLLHNLGPVSLLSLLAGSLLLNRLINFQSGPLYDSLWIENSSGLDYGSGMAHSFFHGYLKLVIPKTGTQEKDLEELMKDYEDKHHVKLEFYKLFILIPKSLYCFTSLMDTEFSPSIEESQSLEPKEITVAGVQKRVYKNSVYKIKNKGRKVYVAAEYATPLKTFKDVVNYNGKHSNYYKKHKNDIVLQFYLTLKLVLKEHVECTNYCELIFYDDKDENGRFKDVGEVLLQRIQKLKKK